MAPKEPLFQISKIPWRKFRCFKSEVRIDIVLRCGQCFRWKKLEDEHDSWLGVIQDKVFILSQNESEIKFKCYPDNEADNIEEMLNDYFQLRIELAPLYKQWSKVDPVFDKVSSSYPGVRMLRQDPTENLFSFICSSNNNIQRISSMVENLCLYYGEKLCKIQETKTDVYSFPKISKLAKNSQIVEKKLRSLGFGYRAAYIAKTAKHLHDLGGEDYLRNLRTLPYEEARLELLKCSGIGPKVADCILLMSLDQPSAIPVDTHMFQIAAKQYLPHLKQYKSVTDKIYKEIGDHFRKLYGSHAGWAHSVLFSGDLKHLQDLKRIVPSTEAVNKSKKRQKCQ